jgi:hypothetical protein
MFSRTVLETSLVSKVEFLVSVFFLSVFQDFLIQKEDLDVLANNSGVSFNNFVKSKTSHEEKAFE